MKNKEQLAEQYAEEQNSAYTNDYNGFLAGFEAGQPKWISVEEQTPPQGIELLVKSPKGFMHLTNWREYYNIFSCQAKTESSNNWRWMEIPQ